MMLSTVRAFTAGVFSVLSVSSLSAQEIKPIDVYQDPNGIDLVSNNVSTSQIPVLSIPAAPELAFQDLADFIPLLETVTGDQSPGDGDPNIYTVSAGRLGSDVFAQCQLDVCYASNGTGGMLVNTEIMGEPNPPLPIGCELCPPPIDLPLPGDVIGGPGVVYRQGDSGRSIRFDIETEISSGTLPQPVKKYLADEIRNANGVDISIQYESINLFGIVRHRPITVTSTSGFQLKFTYSTNALDYGWGVVSKAEIVALSNPNVALASHTYFANTVTDIAGRVFECVCQIDIYPTQPKDRSSRMKLPGESDYAFRTFRQHNSNIRTVTSDGIDYQYVSTPQAWPNTEDAIQDLTITGPNGFYQFVDVTNLQATTGQFDPPRRRIDSITDSLGRTTTYQYRADQRLVGITYPEGNAVSVVYDSFGNLVSRTDIAKPSSGLASITQSAFFSSSGCGAGGFECYFPAWTQDGKGNRTDFTWSAGLLLTQLDPPDEGGKRRKVKNTWSGTGPINGEVCPNITLLGEPEPQCSPRLIREEICEADVNGNELTCGTANSFVRQFTYFGTTRLPASVTVTDGAGNGPLTTTYTYDAAGRQLSIDGPLPGSGDATYARYDVLGRKVWEIGPIGENGLRQATRTTYRAADDQVTRVEHGMVAGTTTANAPVTIAFVNNEVLRQVDNDYNARRLAVRSTVSSGGTAYAITQMSYDGLNREDCSVVRLNLTNPPASACTVGTPNVAGELDRVSRKHYDTESQIVRIEQGVGTPQVRDYATYTFTLNGKMASMTDARGFRAAMLYDGHDRQSHWYFPQPNQTGTINLNDYELYTYDANGNRTSLRKRDGSVISYQYDNLNRVIRKTVPERGGLASVHSRDVFYQYDIRGLQLWARFDSDNGPGTTSTYDRYGRVIATIDNTGGAARELSYTYDARSNRTSIRHAWDNAIFSYDYSAGGQFNRIRDPGSLTLVDYNYNARGELSQAIKYLSAPDQNWTYDPLGRMASITIDSPSNTFDVTWSFTRNPASQIRSETQTNDSYRWNAFTPVTRTYATNGLNQYTSVSGQGYCYDPNGNLTADGEYVYLYDVENRLVEMRAQGTGNGNCLALSYAGQFKAQLRYDPLGRLYETTNYVNGVSQGALRFVHDGDALVAEFNGSGTVLARHVHGPAAGVDDPLVSYEGSSVTMSAARFLQSDARGSIVYSSSSADALRVVNSYDEYGQPGTGNAGRFQYTGQVWLPELGMYYYKARIYSPRLGRFMQTDPIGYGDKVNLYQYGASDPINWIDPTGLSGSGLHIAAFLQNFGSNFSEYKRDSPRDIQNSVRETSASAEASNLSGDGGPPISNSGKMHGPDYFTDEETLTSLRVTFSAAPVKPGSSADSKAEKDPWVSAALNPLVRRTAAITGEIFWIPSRFNPFGAAVLQAPGTFRDQVGIYEYLIPLSGPISSGEPFLFSGIAGPPMVTHARFVRGGQVGDVPFGN